VLKRLRQDHQAIEAKRFLKSTAPDFVVISCGAFADDLWWCRACQWFDIPYVIIVHAVAESFWPRDERVRQILDAYHGAKRVFFVSEGNRKLVETMLGSRLPHASVVRNPFNVDYTVACPYPTVESTLNLACVGRLDPAAKGQDLLLEVLNLEKWRRRNLKVSFYGRGGNAESLKALSRLLELSNIAFFGHTSSVADMWRTHHLLVLPSRYEGLPIALVEAMLCARSAVVTNVAGNAEVLDDNETGFVAGAPTVAHLDEAMERAWNRRSDWAAMGAEAARRIRLHVPQDPVGVFTDELIRLSAP
jgi:glycosyltransferase involved in cell wall biosynthesis